MSQERFSHIAHRGMRYHNPLHPDKIHRVLRYLDLPENSEVLEIGSGPGELLCELSQLYESSQVTGVDPSQESMAIARDRLAQISFKSPPRLIEKPISEVPIPKNSQDCIVALGASHALGTYDDFVREARSWLKDAGLLLVADGYWKQPPPQEYLDFLGCPESAYRSLSESIAFTESLGFHELYTTVSSQEEWDEYEGRYLFNIESYAHKNPNDEATSGYLSKIRRWRRGYLNWGRDSLGFALHLFRKSHD